MSSITLNGDTSGSVQLTVPAVAGSSVITVPSGTGTIAVQGVSTNIVSGTPQTLTSGTSYTFTGIPSYVKRITFVCNGLKTNGSSLFLVQLGTSSGIVSSGYLGYFAYLNTTSNAGSGSSSAGFPFQHGGSSDTLYCNMTIMNISGNNWLSTHSGGFFNGSSNFGINGGGSIALSSVPTSLTITSSSADTFTAGTVNIFYE